MTMQSIFDRALPEWTRRIAEGRLLGVDPSELVAMAVAIGDRLHVEVATTIRGARVGLEAVEPGLAASLLDDGACPPLPLAVVIRREPSRTAGKPGRVVAWERRPIDLGQPS